MVFRAISEKKEGLGGLIFVAIWLVVENRTSNVDNELERINQIAQG